MSLVVRCTDVTLRKAVESQGTSVVIYDRFRNPLVIVVEYQPGLEVIYNRTDPEFANALYMLGLPAGGETKPLQLAERSTCT